MRCQPGRRTLLFSLSFTLDSDLTANLSLALRAARVEAVCPSEAAVRALNLCGGVNPSNPPLPAMGSAPPALVKASTRPRPGGAATLRSPQYSKCRSNYVIWSLVSIKKRARQLKTCFNYRVLLSLPLEGKGDRFAVDEVN